MKKLLPVLLSVSFMISVLGFTSKDNNTITFDTKKFVKAANELTVSSPLNKINNSPESKSAIVGNNWSNDARNTLVSAGFNPEKFRPDEVFLNEAKKTQIPEDSITDAMSVRTYNGQTSGSFFGYSVASAGDVNGDGYADIIIGAYGYNSYTGRAYIFYGGLVPHYTPDIVLNGQFANDNFGYSVSSAGDVNGDGYADVIVGAFGYNSGTGRAYIYYGGIAMDNVPDVILNGESVSNYFGYSVSTAGDVNGDGYSDVIVGASNYNGSTGRTYIYYGGANMLNLPRVVMTGEAVNNNFGFSVSSAGDVNGDGYSDVIVGARGYNSNTGRAYIYLGSFSMDNIADVIMTGEGVNNYFGWAVSGAGDVNGDGFADVIVGAEGYNSYTGRAYIFLGGYSMDNNPDVNLTGESTSNYFGISVSSVGDVNGDGYSDVIIGADFYNTGTGRAYIFYGGANINNIPDITLTGETAGSHFGASVSGAGDVNGDGYADVIVGAYAYNGSYGRAYVFIQSMTGPDIPDLTMTGEAVNNYLGYSVANAGDVNGDGFADILISAPGYNSFTGRVYIYFGGPTMDNVADVILTGAGTNYDFGNSASSAGDVNGDGYDDVIVGAYGYNSNTGRAFIFYGGVSMDNTPDVLLNGEATGNNFGYSVAGAGDVNGDGYADVFVGAYAYNSSMGRAYIYYGGQSMDNIADVTMTGETISDRFGYSVSYAGDVNSDGYSDVIVGAYGYNSFTGRAYIYFGGVNMDNTADNFMTGEFTNNQFGLSVSSAGDVNGDGFMDVIIGAPNFNAGQGKAYLFFGSTNMDNTADVIMLGEPFFGTYFGYSVSSADDVNGDGYSDVTIGAYGYNSGTGRAYIYFGGASMNNTADVVMTGFAPSTNFGYSVAGGGDVNGDGFADVIVGAYAYSSATGRSFLYITTTPVIKPTLISVSDFPKDQGGKVILRWARSGFDIPGMNMITGYLIQKSPVNYTAWENITTIISMNEPQYTYTAVTGADSVPYKYRITAQTSNPLEYWRSNIMSGFSVDNLPPLQVKNLAGNMDTVKINLHWKQNTDIDLAKYRIYRNNILYAERTDTTLSDFSVIADSTYKYKVAAVDIHGNEGIKSDSVQFVFGQLQLNLTVLIQGFYDNISGKMVKDTVTVLLKNITSPYATVDSAKITLDSLGQGIMKLSNIIRNGTFYVVIRHRNSIETWSTAGGLLFDKSINSYDFTTAITQAYGSNLLLNGTKWCIISGDANQDGSIDALDRSACWNDRNLSGYYTSDLNGDGVVDALDRSIAWNNRNLSVQKPALMANPTREVKQDKKMNKDNLKGTKDLKLNGSNAKKVVKIK